VRADALTAGSVSTTGDPLDGVGVLLDCVGVPLAVAAGLVSCTGGVLVRGRTTVVVGSAAVVTGADVLRGTRFGVLGMVVVTGAWAVGSIVVTGGLGSVDATVGCVVTSGAAVVADGGVGITTDGFVCGDGSRAGGADGITVTVGVCADGVDTLSGPRPGFGVRPAGLGGPTAVVVGSVAGSANDGVIPPVRAVNEIAVPVASTTTNPRPRQVRNAALIGS
jgi:hypothetical protein